MVKFFLAFGCVLFFSTQTLAADFSEEYAACIEEADGMTQKLLNCDALETLRQDVRLNKAYQTLLKTLPERRLQLLRESQRAWLLFRDADCKFKLNLDEGESSQLNASGCLLTAIADRVESLESELSFNEQNF